MDAPAIVQHPDAAVRALDAGVDILLYSHDEQVSADAYPVLLKAVETNRVSRATLLAAYRKVQLLKKWAGTPGLTRG